MSVLPWALHVHHFPLLVGGSLPPLVSMLVRMNTPLPGTVWSQKHRAGLSALMLLVSYRYLLIYLRLFERWLCSPKSQALLKPACSAPPKNILLLPSAKSVAVRTWLVQSLFFSIQLKIIYGFLWKLPKGNHTACVPLHQFLLYSRRKNICTHSCVRGNLWLSWLT